MTSREGTCCHATACDVALNQMTPSHNWRCSILGSGPSSYGRKRTAGRQSDDSMSSNLPGLRAMNDRTDLCATLLRDITWLHVMSFAITRCDVE